MSKYVKFGNFISIFLLALFMAMPAFAYSDTTISVPVTSNDKIEVEVTNVDNSVYGNYIIDKTGNIDFSFVEPGNYEFYVKQKISTQNPDVKYDDTIWYLLISVMDESDSDDKLTCYSIINNIETNEKNESLEFINIYPEPETTIKIPEASPLNPVKTGNTNNPLAYVLIMILSIILMVFSFMVLVKNKKTK